MVLLEAQACGKPVVAGASGGTAETMQPGVTGEIVPCDDAGPLAALATELLGDSERRHAMGAAGRAWVSGRFGWEPLCQEAQLVFTRCGRSLPAATSEAPLTAGSAIAARRKGSAA
jgi:phosphatidylinositol alpha-1,6-mannosyltransferase